MPAPDEPGEHKRHYDWYCPCCDTMLGPGEVILDDDPPAGLTRPTPPPWHIGPHGWCKRCGSHVVRPAEDGA
jgi:hypothetical protein